MVLPNQATRSLARARRAVLVGIFMIIGVLTRQARSEGGQTMAEYGILLGMIAVVVVAVAVLLGSSISSLFSNASRRL
jgi:Flp pilus assembly pilin Flp